MTAFAWWIDEPLVMGSSNPGDVDLGRLRTQGFSVAVSLLVENKQPPRYDKKSAADAGWSINSIPIEEGCAPSLDQIRDFTARLTALPAGTKVLVFWDREKGTGYFSIVRSSDRMLEALLPRIPRGQQGGYAYHVINRGNGRATVFHKPQDYEAFLSLLSEREEG